MREDILIAKKEGNRQIRKAWDRHLELLRQDVPPIEEVIAKINAIKNLRIKAFVSIMYLSGARLEELIKHKKIATGKEYRGIVRKDIRVG